MSTSTSLFPNAANCLIRFENSPLLCTFIGFRCGKLDWGNWHNALRENDNLCHLFLFNSVINLTMSAGAQRTPQVKGTQQTALDGNGNGNDAGGRGGGAATATGEDIGAGGLLGKVEPIRLVSLPPVSQRGRLDTLGRLRLEPTRTIQSFTRRG
jgi:hypothetical protein